MSARVKALSLSFKEKTKNLLVIGGYIAAGGIGSILLLFLLRKSWSFSDRTAKEYQRQIQTTRQSVHELEQSLQLLKLGGIELADLKPQNETVIQAIADLKDAPEFFSSEQQKNLETDLERQESLLFAQSESIDLLQASQKNFTQSCAKIANFKQEIINDPGVLTSSGISDRQLLAEIDRLLDLSIIYCQTRERQLGATIQARTSKINLAIDARKFDEVKFLIDEFTSRSEDIVAQAKIQTELSGKISLDAVLKTLDDLERQYFDRYGQQLTAINNYRLLSALLLLFVVIFIAYKIISNLARTNRNIVKILEGFTKELETKVEERTAQLEESVFKTETALAQAQNANQAKSRFLANMSHELRTPLNAILGFTQLMTRDTAIGDEQQENLKIINRSGEHLLQLINDILEMSKIEVGQITLNESQFDLHIMLKSIEEMLRLKANAKNLNLAFEIASDVPTIIEADEGKLRQIIINLLGNALKFTQTGSIILKVQKESGSKLTAEQIDFLFADTYNIYFAVEDTGPGIEPEEIEQLFTPFEQTKIGRISNEGTGLGLSICHKFVELMGGELQAKSTVGQGSVFYFQIPLREQSAAVDTTTQNRSQKILALAENQPAYRILAVDDVPASRLLLNKLLTTIGFEVREAGDGREAIAVWESWQPQLILMDMRMPIVDGYEATKQIKAREGGKDTVIIALTASAFEEERVEILSAGCDDFMRKPFQEEELLSKIGQYLNVEYQYEQTKNDRVEPEEIASELTKASLAVMPDSWRSQLYDAAAQVDNQEIFQLLQEIPDDYQTLAQGLADLAEQFRCDKIIDLAKSAD